MLDFQALPPSSPRSNPCYDRQMNLFLRILLSGLLGVSAATHAQSLNPLPAFSEPGGVASAPMPWGSNNLPLPESQAFRAEILPDTPRQRVLVQLLPAPGYYLYRQSFGVSSPNASVAIEAVNTGETFDDPHFGAVEVFFKPVELSILASQRQGERIALQLHFQGCQNDGICYPPMTREFVVDAAGSPIPVAPQAATAEPALPGKQAAAPPGAQPESVSPQARSVAVTDENRSGAPLAQDQALAAQLQSQSAGSALVAFLGMGVLLGLTPCVLPMVPIVLGLVAGPAAGPRRTLWLASLYVLAHALVFAGMGAAAAFLGGGLAAFLQSPWLLIPMALLLGGLGAGLLLGKELQLPAAVQAWAGRQGRGGSAWGALAMGGASAGIIGPCVAPPLAGAVLFLGQTGNIALGAGALFALGLGMGLPMLAAAAGLGKWMPRTGRWSQIIQAGFGLGLIGLAGWLATRTLPLAVAVSLAAGILMAVGLALAWHRRRALLAGEAPHLAWNGRGVGVGLASVAALSVALAWAQPTPAPAAPLFTQVADLPTLDSALAQADGRTVVLDFYADWCTACLDMEQSTFRDEQVRARLQGQDVVALKIDVTANTPEQRALMARYGIVGPPATLFFHQGQEQRDLRLVGYEAQAPFLSRLGQAQCRAEVAQLPPNKLAPLAC